MAIEDIVERLKAAATGDDETDARRRWRARLLENMTHRPPPAPDDPSTLAFTMFCVGWFTDNDRSVIPDISSNHSAGQGWLEFETPAGLIYKAYGWVKKPGAAVDLYPREYGFRGGLDDLRTLVDTVGAPRGFAPDVDMAKPPNPVLRYPCAKMPPSDGAPAAGSVEEAAVVDALEACSRAAKWLAVYSSLLHAG